jgi:hypothetical protein
MTIAQNWGPDHLRYYSNPMCGSVTNPSILQFLIRAQVELVYVSALPRFTSVSLALLGLTSR